MAERIRKLTNSEVEVLARIIADTMTGSQMNEIFQECGVQDVSNESTKWKRIYYTFLARQEQDGASNSFLNFIKKSHTIKLIVPLLSSLFTFPKSMQVAIFASCNLFGVGIEYCLRLFAWL